MRPLVWIPLLCAITVAVLAASPRPGTASEPGEPAPYALDRIEEDLAIFEVEGEEVALSVSTLRATYPEGVVLDAALAPDVRAEERLRQEIARRRAKLSVEDDGGDLDLDTDRGVVPAW